ncbi:Ctr copper transporter [Mycena vulgaris]|nr:Ctr copper transporter [Mycena vulgaris]
MDHHMPMPRCSMNMLWNTQIVDTCIVFRSWHVSSTTTFIVSCALIMGLGVLYEAIRVLQKKVDTRIALDLAASAPGGISLSLAGDDVADAGAGVHKTAPKRLVIPLMFTALSLSAVARTAVPLLPRLLRAALYGASVFLSFFLMLVFMTYNAYLILATVLGAALGHFVFSGTVDVDALLRDEAKGMACH